MAKNRFWKLQSNDKLSSKLRDASNPSSPIQFFNSSTLTQGERQQFQGFSLMPIRTFSKQQKDIKQQEDIQPHKYKQSLKLQEIERKVRQRQQLRITSGCISKKPSRFYQQLKQAQKELQQKELELIRINSELNLLEQSAKLEKKHNEEFTNNQNMLKFKEDQLNNLKAFHSEIVQGTKKDIIREKKLKQQNQQHYANKNNLLNEFRIKIERKENMVKYIQQLVKQKAKLETYLTKLKTEEEQKKSMRAGVISKLVENIIKDNKQMLQSEYEQRVKLVRDSSLKARSANEMKSILRHKGITQKDYYTFNQLKYVPEFNFRQNKEGDKIYDVFDKEVNPKISDIIEEIHSPSQLVALKSQIKRLDDFKSMSDVELTQKEAVIKNLQQELKISQSVVAEWKKKSETK